jgi:hypothetical protein
MFDDGSQEQGVERAKVRLLAAEKLLEVIA